MNFNTLDLNLLLVFDALMRRRRVTRAGEKIGLSQSATSNSLQRLRHALGDPLFVRTPISASTRSILAVSCAAGALVQPANNRKNTAAAVQPK